MKLMYLNPFYWERRIKRKLDFKFLFPAINRIESKDLTAKAKATLLHCSIDEAWQFPEEFSESERIFIINMVSVSNTLPLNT